MHSTTRSIDYRAVPTFLQFVRSHPSFLTHTVSIGTIAFLWAGGALASQPAQESTPDLPDDSLAQTSAPEVTANAQSDNKEEVSTHLQENSSQPSSDIATAESSSFTEAQNSDATNTSASYEWRPRKYAIMRTPFSVYTHFYVNQYRDALPNEDSTIASSTELPLEQRSAIDRLAQGSAAQDTTIDAGADLRSAQVDPATPVETMEAPGNNTGESIEPATAEEEPPAIEPTNEGEPPQNQPDPAEITQPTAQPQGDVLRQGSKILGTPSIRLQGVYLQEGDDGSARARATLLYPISENLLFGAEADLTSGNGFSDSPGTGLNLNELYLAVSPKNAPQLRFVVGLMDLTSYFDRNSFAKDAATHFFNRAFQTNPALAAAGIASRPGALVNWSVTDNLEVKAAAFSSRRNLGDLALDSFAGEVGARFGNLIVRGTYVTSRDAGKDTGFEEIFQIDRGGGDFGLDEDDRETAFGLNAEYFIPALKLGLFGRYGWYNNTDIDEGGNTFSVGLNLLDLFLPSDRLGIAYGRQLSNNDLRRDNDDEIPDVLEVFYDIRVARNLRAGVMLQERNGFSETVLGFRIKTELNFTGRR
jgi:hypothetical protein